MSAFDFVAYKPDPDKGEGSKLGPGIPEETETPYLWGFGVDRDNPTAYDLSRRKQFLQLLESLDIRMVNISAGSPYYNPHIQRPARCFRRRTAISRRRTRWWERRGRSTPRSKLKAGFQTWCWSAPATPTCRSSCHTSLSGPCGTAKWTRSDWDAWFSPAELPADTLREGRAERQTHLPHVLGLHHRSAQRAGVGLLSARPLYKGREEAALVKKIRASL
ncbi:MAG: hypothetical protein R2748_01430 [Bryobacterales bacterium]